jgi:hypothetical protein
LAQATTQVPRPTGLPRPGTDFSSGPSGFGSQSNPEFDVVEFVNNLPVEVPLAMRRHLWGYLNSLLGLTFLDANEAKAQYKRAAAMVLRVKAAIPARKITDTQINDLEQFLEFCRLKIYQAKLRPRGAINERLTTSFQVTETITSGNSVRSERKKLLPWGPI